MVIKVCTVCGDEFDARNASMCCSAACRQIVTAERKRAYHGANREKFAEYWRVYNEANREKNAERKRAYNEANREKNAERNRTYKRNKNLRITQITAQFKEV